MNTTINPVDEISNQTRSSLIQAAYRQTNARNRRNRRLKVTSISALALLTCSGTALALSGYSFDYNLDGGKTAHFDCLKKDGGKELCDIQMPKDLQYKGQQVTSEERSGIAPNGKPYTSVSTTRFPDGRVSQFYINGSNVTPVYVTENGVEVNPTETTK